MQKQRIQKYNKYVVAEDFILVENYNNIMQLPTFVRAVINTTSKEYLIEKKQSINALAACFLLSGQKSIITRARKSIAGFKLREGALLGCRTTLRRRNLYTIMDKLLIFTLPRLNSGKKKNTKSVLESTNNPLLKESLPDIKNGCILNQDQSKHTTPLAQQERYQLNVNLEHLEKNHNEQIHTRETRNPPKRLHHLAFGIKDFILIPELQEFLPLFQAIRGINLGISFSNPKIKSIPLFTNQLPILKGIGSQYKQTNFDWESSIRTHKQDSLLSLPYKERCLTNLVCSIHNKEKQIPQSTQNPSSGVHNIITKKATPPCPWDEIPPCPWDEIPPCSSDDTPSFSSDDTPCSIWLDTPFCACNKMPSYPWGDTPSCSWERATPCPWDETPSCPWDEILKNTPAYNLVESEKINHLLLLPFVPKHLEKPPLYKKSNKRLSKHTRDLQHYISINQEIEKEFTIFMNTWCTRVNTNISQLIANAPSERLNPALDQIHQTINQSSLTNTFCKFSDTCFTKNHRNTLFLTSFQYPKH